jgi:hypothetical protein
LFHYSKQRFKSDKSITTELHYVNQYVCTQRLSNGDGGRAARRRQRLSQSPLSQTARALAVCTTLAAAMIALGFLLSDWFHIQHEIGVLHEENSSLRVQLQQANEIQAQTMDG